MKFVTFQKGNNSKHRFGFKKNDHIIDIVHASNWVHQSNNDPSFLDIPSSLKDALENWVTNFEKIKKLDEVLSGYDVLSASVDEYQIIQQPKILSEILSQWHLSVSQKHRLENLIKRINILSEEFEEKFWRSKSAETFYNGLPSNVEDPMTSLFKESMQGLLKSKSKTNLAEKMGGILEVGIEKQISKIEKGFIFLATVGSTAPFIGLFGTVWGIMNSFQSIAISRNTSLAIVAPGIAEALFATALGLLAAIPAVVAYNKFNSDSKKYSQRLENFSKRFLSII